MAISTVNGKVGRTFFDGKGAEIVESWISRGETFTKRWSAFFEQPHGLSEGDVVSVSGMHGDKIDEWEKDGQTRHAIKRTLNKATVGKPKSPTPAQEEPWAPSEPATGGDVWSTSTYDDSEKPF